MEERRRAVEESGRGGCGEECDRMLVLGEERKEVDKVRGELWGEVVMVVVVVV